MWVGIGFLEVTNFTNRSWIKYQQGIIASGGNDKKPNLVFLKLLKYHGDTTNIGSSRKGPPRPIKIYERRPKPTIVFTKNAARRTEI